MIICERCKIALKQIELKDLYQCPMCLTVTEHKDITDKENVKK